MRGAILVEAYHVLPARPIASQAVIIPSLYVSIITVYQFLFTWYQAIPRSELPQTNASFRLKKTIRN